MEILQADDKLREEIINDAKIKAERIIKKAKREAEEINSNLDLQIQEVKKEYEKNILGAANEKIKLFFASVDIEVKKKVTEYSGNLVDETFNDIKDSIFLNKLFNYQDFIFKLIYNAASKIKKASHNIEITDEELKRISKQKLVALKMPQGKIDKIEVVKNLSDGIMLYFSDKKIASYISINKFFKNLKEKERANIYNILLQGNTNG